MKLYTSHKEIEKSISSLVTRGKRYQSDIHKTACSVLRVWNTDGDVRKACQHLNDLHAGLAGAVRTNSFKDWVAAYTGMKWDGSEKAFTYTSTKIDEETVRGAIDNPFWSFSPESEYKALDWMAIIKSAVSRAEKDLEKMGDQSKVNVEQLKVLQTMTMTEDK